MKKITFVIEYAGLDLRVTRNAAGDPVVALKPITHLFGLQWERQRKKLAGSPYYTRFYGVCTVHMYGAGSQKNGFDGTCTPDMGGADGQKREQTCILLSRVAAYLMGISPDQVRAHGNINAADFLEARIEEWANALHDYEELGMAVNLNHVKTQDALRRQRSAFAQMIGVKNKTACAAAPCRPRSCGASHGRRAASALSTGSGGLTMRQSALTPGRGTGGPFPPTEAQSPA